MRFFSHLAVLLTVGFVAALPNANAAMKGHYFARITGDNAASGKLSDYAAAFMGWDCSTSTSSRFQERLKDHKGREKDVTQKIKSNGGSSLFANPEITMEFERDMTKQGKLQLDLTESCTKEVRTVCNDERSGVSSCTETRSVTMTWSCVLSDLPGKEGARTSLSCSPSQYYFGDSDISNVILVGLKAKTLKAEIALNRIEEKFDRDLCGGSTRDRVVIQLTQGVGGHMGEDDFVFHVNINGDSFDIEEPNGVLNHEVAYCDRAQTFNISVSAMEKDLISHNSYQAKNSLKLSRRAPGNTGTIKLARDTYLGELFTDRAHEIQVTVLDPNPDQQELQKAVNLATNASGTLGVQDSGQGRAISHQREKHGQSTSSTAPRNKGSSASRGL